MIGVQTQRQDRKIRDGELQPADILLVHTKRSLWGWLIRRGTHSYWNHALMVCRVGDNKQEYDNILAVDAKTNGSIVLSRVSDYLKKPDKYDVAVKRLRVDWSDDDGQYPALDLYRRICRIAMDEVQLAFSTRLANVLNQLVRQCTVICRFLRHKINKAYKPPRLPLNTRPSQVKAFSCGGFVQWCYYMGVLKASKEKGGNRSRLNDVIFSPKLGREPTVFELLTTTPADLANSDKLSWTYVIEDGVLRHVSNNGDVILAAAPA